MNTFRRLLYTLLFLLTTHAIAEITINGHTVHVETNNYKVQFDHGGITSLHNKLTDETYTLLVEPIAEIQAAILGRTRNFWARDADTVETRKIDFHTAEIRFRNRGTELRLIVGIDPHTNDLLISGDCVSNTPGVKAIQWGIDKLNLTNLRLVVPSDKRQVFDAASEIKQVNLTYPSTRWEAQLAIIEAERGGFYIRGEDPTFQFKELYYYRHIDTFGLGFRSQNQAPWDTLTTAKHATTWRLNTYAGDWCVPAQIYRDWMEQTFDPWRLSDVPAWVSDISLVVLTELDKGVLEPLADLVDPTNTLLYLTNWNKDRPPRYPDYTPHDNFGDFVETAHRLGFRVMPHVNLYDCSAYHPLYSEFKKYQYRDPETGGLSGWNWEQIGDPERSAHISLASSRWRNLLVQEFKALWEKYHIDAFFIDVSHYILNDANGLIEGLTSAEGNVLMHKELVQAMPGVVFSGEGLHEVTFFRESFAKRRILRFQGTHHPISMFLFSPYTRFHGGDGTPGTGASKEFQNFVDITRSQGYLPTFVAVRAKHLNIPSLQDMLALVRQYQAPDINCDSAHQGDLPINVAPNPDINRDGQINILDLILIANKFGQQVLQPLPEDLNGDGVIDILDLILVVQNMTDVP